MALISRLFSTEGKACADIAVLIPAAICHPVTTRNNWGSDPANPPSQAAALALTGYQPLFGGAALWVKRALADLQTATRPL